MTKKRIYSDEERKERRKIAIKKYYEKHKEKILLYHQTHYRENKEAHQKNCNNYRNKNYYCKPSCRASGLLSAYNQLDRKYNRGKGDLTAQWIAENILSKPCVYCGESDWRKIGCNRLDNTKPHSKDNVEPCCRDCNLKLPRKTNQMSENS